MSELSNSTRRVSKATLVSLGLEGRGRSSGAAIVKFGFVRGLALQPGETDALAQAGALQHERSDELRSALVLLEGDRPPADLPSPTVFADVPSDHLVAIGNALVAIRRRALTQRRPEDDGPQLALAATAAATQALNLVNTAIVATRSFEANVAATPIGMLNLERIEMKPAGVERGALLATIPLAPLEKTTVIHKEWSVTTKEFTSIVTDSLENISETGVTDNTELTQAATSQVQHGNQFNVNGTVSGNYGLVSSTVSSGFTAQNQASESASESRKHAVSVTRRASSRVTQEHKVTISTKTETGASETSTRTIENPSATDALRIDYFSLMRKWHVGLYRYGLRLTYDLAIPEPGATMRRLVAELAVLRELAARAFAFDVKPSDVTNDVRPGETLPHYLVLADRYQAQVPHYPDPGSKLTPNRTTSLGNGWHFYDLSFDVPAGHVIRDVWLDALVGDLPGPRLNFSLLGSALTENNHAGALTVTARKVLDFGGNPFLAGATGHQTVTFFTQDGDQAWVGLTVYLDAAPEKIEEWRSGVWTALFNAAQTAYYGQQQVINARIQAIEQELASVDTLTLRREENEEIMKGVLRWLLGPTFDFMPPEVNDLFKGQKGADLAHGIAFTGNELGLTSNGWRTMFLYEEMVKFINQAIEWENILYFLYPYFWDVPASWDFIRSIRHPDAIRQAFLRAGSARVVLTVRRGWEEAWVQFVETGGFGKTLLPDHPYLSIAREIQAYDRTNYPGIPPANPDGTPAPDKGAFVATTSSAQVAASPSPVTIEVTSSDGFTAGSSAILDTYESGAQEVCVITDVPDDTHVTVRSVAHAHDGTSKPFAVLQAGEQGQLIAEWFEYTPTSGTDIALTSPLTDMA